MANPEISIICPVFNAEKYIDKLIQAIINQSFSDWELILINDGSTDRSRLIIENYLKDKRIVLLDQANSGPSVARNSGINIAMGQWITFVDADDIVTNNYLEILLEPTKSNTKIELVCAGYFEQNKYNQQGIPLHDFQEFYPKSIISKPEFLNNIFKGVTGVLWSKLFDRSIVKQHEIRLNDRLKLSEDLVFVLQYVKQISNIALVYDNIYYYNRINEVGLSGNLDLSYLDNIKIFNDLVIKEYNEGDKLEILRILNIRTIQILIKILKNQNQSTDQLKKSYNIIQSQFEMRYESNLGLENKIFLYLLQNRIFLIAHYFDKVCLKIRELKNA